MNRAGVENGWKAKLIHYTGFINYLDPSIQDLVGPADLIIYQRNIAWQEALDAMEYWQGLGKPVLVDLDDAYQMLPWTNPAHKFWHEEGDGKFFKVLEEGVRRSDGLVSPNRLLLQDWAYCSNSYYVRNYAEPGWWTDLPSRQASRPEPELKDKIIIGWGGSVSHYDSFWGTGVREAAERISMRHPEVVWLICGNDRRLYEQLPVPRQSKAFQEGVPPQIWPKIVKKFDIGIAPLYGIYDQRRSWIKGMEYLLAGVPWVGTAGEPYSDIAELGMMIQNTQEQWEDALEGLIANLPSAQATAEKFIPQAQQLFFVDNQLDEIRRVYEQAIADRNAEKGRLAGIYYYEKPVTASA